MVYYNCHLVRELHYSQIFNVCTEYITPLTEKLD